MLPGAQLAATQSEVSFAAWTQQPLGSFKVDGSSPQRRDLNLLIMPLSVRFPVGHFRLRTGTLTAHLVDIDPQITSSPCCPRPPGTAPVFVGSGGSATFAWQMPRATRVHFRRLVLSVDAGGAIGTHIGTVWNWRRDRWDPINLRYGDAPLSNPDRYVSPSGTVLLRLHATDASRDISMPDTRQALQISGEGEVE
jgi:hypothetical protein